MQKIVAENKSGFHIRGQITLFLLYNNVVLMLDRHIMRFVLLLLLSICLPLFAFCNKPEIIIEPTISEAGREAFDHFQDLNKRGLVDDAFLFFTDPHLLSWEDKFSDETKNVITCSFAVAKELYDALSLELCLCGGDWLNFGDTQAMAKEKLLFADSLMNNSFSHYYKMMGNHDTNYQGIISSDNNKRGDLPIEFVNNQYFSETGSAFFRFETKQTEFFILDSGLDWDISLNENRIAQLLWLGDELKKSISEHKIVGIHMFYNDVPLITPMAKELVDLILAFNDRGIYTNAGKLMNFSNSIGTVHFVITGHCHVDFMETINGIPIIGTHKFYDSTRPFDIFAIDYDSGMVEMIRVGIGSNREFKMAV